MIIKVVKVLTLTCTFFHKSDAKTYNLGVK